MSGPTRIHLAFPTLGNMYSVLLTEATTCTSAFGSSGYKATPFIFRYSGSSGLGVDIGGRGSGGGLGRPKTRRARSAANVATIAALTHIGYSLMNFRKLSSISTYPSVALGGTQFDAVYNRSLLARRTCL